MATTTYCAQSAIDAKVMVRCLRVLNPHDARLVDQACRLIDAAVAEAYQAGLAGRGVKPTACDLCAAPLPPIRQDYERCDGCVALHGWAP